MLTRADLITAVGNIPDTHRNKPVPRAAYIITAMWHAASAASDMLSANAARTVYNHQHALALIRRNNSAAAIQAQIEAVADAVLAERLRLETAGRSRDGRA